VNHAKKVNTKLKKDKHCVCLAYQASINSWQEMNHALIVLKIRLMRRPVLLHVIIVVLASFQKLQVHDVQIVSQAKQVHHVLTVL
jgi:hypothetical protein